MNYAHSNTNVPQAAPMGPIPGAIEGLKMSLNDLSGAVSVLYDRLSGVLTPQPPATAPSNDRAALKDVSRVTGPMLDDIEQQRMRVNDITHSLQDVLNRLEV